MGVSQQSPRGALTTLGALLRAERLSRNLSLRELAARTNVSNAYLSQVERGLHEPSLSVLRALTSALGTPLGPLLERAGLLGQDASAARTLDVTDTEAAIAQDAALSPPQRLALLSIYRSFVPRARDASER